MKEVTTDKTRPGARRGQDFKLLLSGKDLRSIGNSERVARSVRTRRDFARLFKLMFADDRRVAMRAADAVEKITRRHPEYLTGGYQQLIVLMKNSPNKEMKWHIAQLVARLNCPPDEFKVVWRHLTYWVRNPHESKIVRVNALQALFDLCSKTTNVSVKRSFVRTLAMVERLHEPSLLARARILRAKMAKRAPRRTVKAT